MMRRCSSIRTSVLVPTVALAVLSTWGMTLAKTDHTRAARTAQWYIRKGKLSKALQIFKNIVVEEPRNMDACFNAGNIARHMKKCRDVLLYFRCFLFMSNGSGDDAIARKGIGECASRKEAVSVGMDTEPPGAEVFVAGVLVGQTPIKDMALWPGRYTFKMRHPDCEPLERELRVEGGKGPLALHYKLKVLPAFGELVVETDPPEGVVVYVDEKKVAVTPMKSVRIPVGKHLVRLAKPGYDRWVRYVHIEKEKSFRLRATLERTSGSPSDEPLDFGTEP